MLTTQKNSFALQNAPQGQFISRIFVDTAGRQFRLTFFVTMVNGELKGRLVTAQPLSASFSVPQIEGSVASEQIFYLPVAAPQVEPVTSYFVSPSTFVSPYFSLEFLINSQPTRAPSF